MRILVNLCEGLFTPFDAGQGKRDISNWPYRAETPFRVEPTVAHSMAYEVTEFIADEAGVPPTSVTRNTRLWHDLRLCGDDLEEVLDRFGKRFGIDLTSLSLANSGPSEATVWCVEAWGYLLSHFPLLRFIGEPQYTPITVDALIRAAEAKTWDVVLR